MKKNFTLLLVVLLATLSSKAAVTFYAISATPNTTSAVITFSISNSTAPFNTNMNIFYDTTRTSFGNDIGNVIFSGANVTNATRSILGLLPSKTYYYQLKSGTTKSAIDSFTTSAILPLTILSFSATQKENTTLLNWTSENEINVSHFNVQSSFNCKDFETIGKVYAGKSSYNFIARLANIYYRLQIIDKDGSTSYSAIKQIKIKSQTANISLYPTIATSSVNISFLSNANQTILFKIVDATGKVFAAKNIEVTAGVNNFNYNCSVLNQGIYFINFNNGNDIIKTEKFYKK